jgi:aminoglycoside phosphotransferase (APT) family kinase protein
MDLHKIKALINGLFPDLSVQTVTKMGNGKAGEIFLVNGEIVFKLPLTSDTSDSDLFMEYKILSALDGKLEIAIPKPLYFGTLPDGRSILGESLVRGEQFTQDIYESFSQAEKDALFEQLGDIFHQLHSADIPKTEGIILYDAKSNLEYFYENYTDLVKKELTEAERNKLEQLARDYCAALEESPAPLALCHGDMHFKNLNYDPETKKFCGLLDFGLINYNDPLNDMRYFWADTVEKMLRNYPGDIGKNAGTRHLFYNLCNLLDEVHGNLKNSDPSEYLVYLKRAMYQQPLPF